MGTLAAMTSAPFADRLAAAVDARGPLCVGLDPRPDRLPGGVAPARAADGVPLAPAGADARAARVPADTADREALAGAYERFCTGVIEAVAGDAAAVKPQVAFFEALGAAGYAARERGADAARDAGLLVIADAKRGDIASTAEAYARGWLHPRANAPPLADALTVNPYLGGDALEPFLRACDEAGAGVYVLVKTSNAGTADLQDVRLADGRRLWERTAALVADCGRGRMGASGLSSVGAVVGATHADALATARAAMPAAPFLLPGVGAQGGRVGDLAPAFARHRAGGLVVAARSVIFAWRGEPEADWRAPVRRAAAALRREAEAVAGGSAAPV
jgi:orotidine-5'-phosphate decarboxylase